MAATPTREAVDVHAGGGASSVPAAAGRLGGRVWAALVVVYLVWGSTYLAIRFAVETLPPLFSGGLRFLTAGLLMLVVMLAVRGRSALRATPAQLATAAASGLLLLGANGMVAVGEQRVASGIAALIVACVPLWIVVLRVLQRDRPAAVTLLGVLVGFGGVALLFLPGGTGTVDAGYAAILVVASLAWAVGSVLVARSPVPADPLMLTVTQMLAGGTALVAVAAGRGELSGFGLAQVSVKSWLAVAYLVVFGSLLAFTAYGWLLGHAPVSTVSTYAYVNPVVAVALGALLAGERLSAAALAGGLLILIAVALVVTAEAGGKRRRRRAAQQDSRRTPLAASDP